MFMLSVPRITSLRLLCLVACAKVFTSCAVPAVYVENEEAAVENEITGYNANNVIIPL
jgi:hypothetical protein